MQVQSYRPNAYPQAKASQHPARPATRFAGGEQPQVTNQPPKKSLDFLKAQILGSVSEFAKKALNPDSNFSLKNENDLEEFCQYSFARNHLRPLIHERNQYTDRDHLALLNIDKDIAKVEEKLKSQIEESKEKTLNDINTAHPDVKLPEISESGEAPEAPADAAKTAPAAETTSDTESPKSKWTPKEERTRAKVLWDVTKQYFSGGKILGDLAWGAGIGAICAIGSPVMAVTIPTTWAIFGGFRLLQLASKLFHNPQGDKIDKMYKSWEPQKAPNPETSSS